MFLGKKTVINRLNFSSIDFFHIAALANPFCAQGRKSLCHIAVKIRITPWAARVVHAHGLVDFDFTVYGLSRCERDFPERNANIGMQLRRQRKSFVNLAAVFRQNEPNLQNFLHSRF